MSELQRYDYDDGGMLELVEGDYVRYDDYASLESARDQYRALSIKYGDKLSETLKELDRLREERDSFQREAIRAMEQRDALGVKLADIKGLAPISFETAKDRARLIERISSDSECMADYDNFRGDTGYEQWYTAYAAGMVRQAKLKHSMPERWDDKLARVYPTIERGKWPKNWQDEAKDQEIYELRHLIEK